MGVLPPAASHLQSATRSVPVARDLSRASLSQQMSTCANQTASAVPPRTARSATPRCICTREIAVGECAAGLHQHGMERQQPHSHNTQRLAAAV